MVSILPTMAVYIHLVLEQIRSKKHQQHRHERWNKLCPVRSLIAATAIQVSAPIYTWIIVDNTFIAAYTRLSCLTNRIAPYNSRTSEGGIISA